MASEPEGTAVAEAPPGTSDALAVLSGDRRWALVEGDCVAAMGLLPPDSVDAVVCDPPYFLSFMGRSWDTPDAAQDDDSDASTAQPVVMQQRHTAWLREAFRVLKPGGHVVAFGGTRTHHRLFVAAEDAGFEVRDMLAWLHGQGFPKSMDVSKAIDDAAGVERPVVGKYQPPNGQDWNLKQAEDPGAEAAPGTFTASGRRTLDVTAPATEDGRRWQGWGTALKPAVEPILLARKPLGGLNIAGNVLRHGTGALNIDASRIRAPGEVVANTGRGDGPAASKGVYGDGQVEGPHQTPGQRLGRFPANVVLSHADGCVLNGMKKVQGTAPHAVRSSVERCDGREMFSRKNGEVVNYGDVTGMEDVEDWACVEGCPILELDRQSGPAGAFAPVPVGGAKDSRRGIYGDFASQVSSLDRGSWYGDSGGASRFYYCAKASTSERWFWCRVCGDAYGDESRHSAHERRCATCGKDYPLSKHKAHRDHDTDRNLEQHPTQKPLALMEWLTALVCRPDGVVLDPFSGSGTTGVAATKRGFRFIGCERERNYAAITRRRIEGDSPLFNLDGGAA